MDWLRRCQIIAHVLLRTEKLEFPRNKYSDFIRDFKIERRKRNEFGVR